MTLYKDGLVKTIVKKNGGKLVIIKQTEAFITTVLGGPVVTLRFSKNKDGSGKETSLLFRVLKISRTHFLGFQNSAHSFGNRLHFHSYFTLTHFTFFPSSLFATTIAPVLLTHCVVDSVRHRKPSAATQHHQPTPIFTLLRSSRPHHEPVATAPPTNSPTPRAAQVTSRVALAGATNQLSLHHEPVHQRRVPPTSSACHTSHVACCPSCRRGATNQLPPRHELVHQPRLTRLLCVLHHPCRVLP